MYFYNFANYIFVILQIVSAASLRRRAPGVLAAPNFSLNWISKLIFTYSTNPLLKQFSLAALILSTISVLWIDWMFIVQPMHWSLIGFLFPKYFWYLLSNDLRSLLQAVKGLIQDPRTKGYFRYVTTAKTERQQPT